MDDGRLHIKSTLKTLLVLEQFLTSNTELGIHELSARTGIPPSTVQRIVNTLELKDYLVQNPRTNKYRLGFGLYRVGKAMLESFHWVEEAKYYMEKLVKKYNETVNLAYLQGQSIIYITKIDSSHILRPHFDVGTRFPPHCTSLGKALLAYMQPEVAERIISKRLPACTRKTKTSIKEIKAELEKVRQNGYAIDDEEFQEGLFCIGAPIQNAQGESVAAISMTIPKARLRNENLPAMVDDLLQTATDISNRLKRTSPQLVQSSQ